jgi:hypothetical protein
MFTPSIPPQVAVIGRTPTLAYGSDDSAIYLADFGADSQYIVTSYRLAKDIFQKNPVYDEEFLEHGLKAGQLKLIIQPALFEKQSNPLTAIRVIKFSDPIDTDWYRLFIIPAFNRKTRTIQNRYK